MTRAYFIEVKYIPKDWSDEDLFYSEDQQNCSGLMDAFNRARRILRHHDERYHVDVTVHMVKEYYKGRSEERIYEVRDLPIRVERT